jgi:nucleotide-binding universal stress UspA family protein
MPPPGRRLGSKKYHCRQLFAFACGLPAGRMAEMYKRMLVLLDGSTISEVVFSYARELSGRLGLDLDLLHVCTTQEAEQLPMRVAYIEHMAEQLQKESEEIGKASGAAQKTRRVTGRVVIGYPAEEILEYAENNNIDLIMMATHGRSGIRRWGIGSVADKVIHESPVPVWLVPSQLHEGILYDKLPKNYILVPLDGSKNAEIVLPHVITLAKLRGVQNMEVLLINVMREPVDIGDPSAKELIRENWSAMKTEGEMYLNEVVQRLAKEGITATAEQLVGDPAEEIVRYAANNTPRLIVMSTHGRTGFSRYVFGNTTENVMRRLQKTPLLLVPSPERKKAS